MRVESRVSRVVMQKIIEYCTEIEDYKNQVNATFEVYQSNKMFRRAVDMNVLQIGELTKRLSDDFRAAHPEIPWHEIKGLRNVLVHEYENVDLESAWNDLTKSVPELQAQLEKILAAEAAANEN